jgi:hypothetical protein
MKIKKFLAKKMLEKTGKVCKDEKRNNWNRKIMKIKRNFWPKKMLEKTGEVCLLKAKNIRSRC